MNVEEKIYLRYIPFKFSLSKPFLVLIKELLFCWHWVLLYRFVWDFLNIDEWQGSAWQWRLEKSLALFCFVEEIKSYDEWKTLKTTFTPSESCFKTAFDFYGAHKIISKS